MPNLKIAAFMLSLLNAFIIILFYIVPLLGQSRIDSFKHLYFNVIKNGKVVGRMTCSKYITKDTVSYFNESTVHVSILIDIAINNKVEGTFVNNILYSGSIQRIINGKPRVDNHINRNKDRYIISSNGSSGEIKSNISFTTVCLMHMEPENISLVFSENFKQFLALKKIAQHKYELQLPDGYSNYYTYKDGNCVEVEVPNTFTTIYIKPCN